MIPFFIFSSSVLRSASLLAKFYILDEEGRKQIFDYLDYQAMRHTDKDHEHNLKKI